MFLDDTFIQVEEEAALINHYLNSKKAIKKENDHEKILKESPNKKKSMLELI